MLKVEGDSLIFCYAAETLRIDPWGPNAVRVRCVRSETIPEEDWALVEEVKQTDRVQASITDEAKSRGKLLNGNITVVVDQGNLTIYNQDGKLLLKEFWRKRIEDKSTEHSFMGIDSRVFKSIHGSNNYHITAHFESLDPNERLYGMGQYQQPMLNLKGTDLELAHRNSQASIPFLTSNLGYGFLWNNPSIGRAVFGANKTTFEAYSSQTLDYWVVVGDSPAAIQEAYANVTGKVPMMPEYGLGFWQCKLRYQTQEELLSVVRGYKERNLPLNLIVIDFFHWRLQGDFGFDPVYWPDPAAMMKELKEANVELMVSVWPTVDKRCENFSTLHEIGALSQTERGSNTQMEFEAACCVADFTTATGRKAIWDIIKRNYYSLGIKTFWLDEAEPEIIGYDYDHYRYGRGSCLEVGNIYPRCYAQAFYEGQKAAGQENVVNLLRCAWAGSQRYGALLWSGDIGSSWENFRIQLCAGLNSGLAGIPWWNTDLGGFYGGDPNDEGFRELFVRWFQWGAFCPVMRLHGDREPRQPQQGTTGGATCRSGAANEVWSYGEEVYKICKSYILLREKLRDYTREVMREAHQRGTPVIRTLFYVFPNDKQAWLVEDAYMFGDKYLVAPIMHPGHRKRSVYLPAETTWRLFRDDRAGPIQVYQGGRTVDIDAPLDYMPVFVRA